MAVWYVSRDGAGAVSGLFAAKQPGVAEELLDESNAAVQTWLTTTLAVNRRTDATSLLLAASPLPLAIRGVLLALLAETNRLRDRLAAQDAAVAAATSLANLQSRWATLAAAAPMSDVTVAAAKQAVASQITGGAAD